jgi:hypothetical protein
MTYFLQNGLPRRNQTLIQLKFIYNSIIMGMQWNMVLWWVLAHLGLCNTNGFRIEIMYDYYIAMKFMFLIVKLFFHFSIGYVSLTILLPWTTHKQHQNYSKPKAFQNPKLPFSQTLYSYHSFVQMKVFFKVINTSLNTNQKETNQETS